MAYPFSFVKFTFGGRMAGGDEIWSCGLHLVGQTVNPSSDTVNDMTEAQWDDIVAAVTNYWTDTNCRAPRGVFLNWIKMAAIGTNGKYMGGPREWNNEAGVEGTMTSPYVPQISTVVTIVADKFKDPGKYNRYYLPTTVNGTFGKFKLTKDEANGCALAAKDFINDLNTALDATGTDLRVGVVSERVSSYLNAKNVRVGDLFDTQRRRRNGIYEEYSNQSLA